MQAKFKVGDKIQLISKRILIQKGWDEGHLNDLEEYDWDTVYTIDSIEWEDADLFFTNMLGLPPASGGFVIVVHDDDLDQYEFDDIHMFELVKTVGFVID